MCEFGFRERWPVSSGNSGRSEIAETEWDLGVTPFSATGPRPSGDAAADAPNGRAFPEAQVPVGRRPDNGVARPVHGGRRGRSWQMQRGNGPAVIIDSLQVAGAHGPPVQDDDASALEDAVEDCIGKSWSYSAAPQSLTGLLVVNGGERRCGRRALTTCDRTSSGRQRGRTWTSSVRPLSASLLWDDLTFVDGVGCGKY